MQSIAVLILEMTYGSKHVKSSEPSTTVSIKKLIRWLRAMQHNNPVAARAHDVIRKILKRCAPALQSQADELLALYGEETPQSYAHQHYHTPYNAQQTAQMSQENFQFNPMDTSGTFDARSLPYYSLDNLPGYQDVFDPFYLPEEHIAPMPFSNPFFTNFDHGVPLVNMQDPWIHPGPWNVFDPNLSLMNTPLDVHDGEDGPSTEYSPQQQQFDYHSPRG